MGWHFYGEDAAPSLFRIVPDGPPSEESLKWELLDCSNQFGSLEKDVVELLHQGMMQKDIAKQLE